MMMMGRTPKFSEIQGAIIRARKSAIVSGPGHKANWESQADRVE